MGLRRLLSFVLLDGRVFAGVVGGLRQLLPAPVGHGRRRPGKELGSLWLRSAARIDGNAVHDERHALAASEAHGLADILPVSGGQAATFRGRRFGLDSVAHLGPAG